MINKVHIGNFVVNIHSNDLHEVIDVYESTMCVLHMRLGVTYTTLITDFVPWAPKLNEWCWFLTVNSGYELGQYVGNINDTTYQYKLNMSDSAIFNCRICEPFVGKLPSLLIKEVK